MNSKIGAPVDTRVEIGGGRGVMLRVQGYIFEQIHNDKLQFIPFDSLKVTSVYGSQREGIHDEGSASSCDSY